MSAKIALVTGGAGGIGTEICRTLSREGHRVVTTCAPVFECPNLADWKKNMKAEGFDVPVFEADVADFESCRLAVEQIEKEVGPVDILVNCAGITRDSVLKKMTSDQWQQVLSVNLDSVFNMTRQVFPGMLDRGFGRIVNISSINGRKGQFGQANYSAAKAGMHGFTMAVAQEGIRKGVTVNTISPGYVATEMVKKIREDVLQSIIAQIPAGRLAEPWEIARVVAFLASEKSGFISGANIDINGGQFIH
ncbi:MAG: beta-ketoacyl-ACP reductase [Magnetococcales bacterium]|nr:beta-ketoacyl-ACP reductase [Magnetococcales bacterium]MBF0439470.1 beta-ketoacyl-ACP reductase [Magnetococcales bacterium]